MAERLSLNPHNSMKYVTTVIPVLQKEETEAQESQLSSAAQSDSLRPHGLQPGLPVHRQLLEFTQA